MRIKIELSDELSATVKELAEGTKVLLKSKDSDNLHEVILR